MWDGLRLNGIEGGLLRRGRSALRAKLEVQLARHELGLIILDPAYRVLGDRDENANGEIAGLMNEVEALAQSSGVAVVVALQRDTAKDAGVEWKYNALRHSFISYRVADIKNVAEVALEAGNSPEIIFQHYRELVTGERAKEWFGITPVVIAAESRQVKEEGSRLRAARAEAEKAKAGRKGARDKAGAGAAVPVPAGAKIVAFPAKAARSFKAYGHSTLWCVISGTKTSRGLTPGWMTN